MRTFLFYIVLIFVVLHFPAVAYSQDETSAAATLQISEARLGTSVESRELVGEDSTFALNSKVFLWMKVTGGTSDQITVTWRIGEMSHATTLAIGGSPWRTWATKTASVAGDWTITITDASGKALKEMMFRVTP